MDVDNEDYEESIKMLINNFFVVKHHFGIVFDGELIANDFKYLRDKLDIMVDVDIKDKE